MSLSAVRTVTGSQSAYSSYRLFKQAFDKWLYGYQEYRVYGLYYSDLYRASHPEVCEAIRRLPEDLWTGRAHRIHRALQLSRNKIELPEALWTRQEDPMHKYLDPYLEEVHKEKVEKAEWDKK